MRLDPAGDSIAYPVLSNNAGTFVYKLESIRDANGCSQNQSGTATYKVHANPIPGFEVSADDVTILEPQISIEETSLLASAYSWNFGDGTTSNSPSPDYHTYKDSGSYNITLVVANDLGCVDSIKRTINVVIPKQVYVPNSFSPNGDGLNDVFLPKGEGISEYLMEIYDRWGNLIFISDDINKGWDGTANDGTEVSMQDVYVYVIDIVSSAKKQSFTYRGVIKLIR